MDTDTDYLRPRPANHRPLTPVDLLARTVEAVPDRPAVAWHDRKWTYRQFSAMVARLAAFLRAQGVGRGDVVSVVASNRPEMLAAHYAVPMLGAILNTINIRLDVDTIAYILRHSGSRLIIVDPEFGNAAEAAREAEVALFFLSDKARQASAPASTLDLLDDGEAAEWPDVRRFVTDEWQPICINYTSGTTGRPKGVVYHHRGAYLNAVGNVLALGLNRQSVYLWTLPMFHCNGWCHTWAVTAAGGLHVCLDRIDPDLIFEAIGHHRVTHFSCAPVVLYMLVNHPGRKACEPGQRVTVATGGAAPTPALIEQLDALGFDPIHLYGLTESYGPETLCVLDEDQAGMAADGKARILARQGVRHITANTVRVIGEDGSDVPRNGEAMGEIVLAGNTLMAGYHDDRESTDKAFADGHFHTGDLAVMHPDGAIEIRDRSKDVIISGGENISSLEIESALHQHPAVLLAAVVAVPDPKWGEVPQAFIELKEGMTADAEELQRFCREHLAHFKVPRRFVFQELPKTATGKIQKFSLRDVAREELRNARKEKPRS